jgi:membrane associated rhomboid family serine protease
MIKRFITYPFVHGNFTQTLFGAALLLALGKFVGDVFSAAGVVTVFVVSAVGGAFVFGAVVASNPALIGAYTPVYGLIGAFTYLMWLRLGTLGENRLRAFRLIGFLMAIQLLFGLLFGGSPIWIAEVAGFAFGFAVSLLVAPGGWSAFLSRIRD